MLNNTSPNLTISVITVVRNGAATIAKCLESVAAQAVAAGVVVEHLVVDGNSTDDTLDVCRRFDVRIVMQEGSGIYGAMNQGAHAACGDYLVFLNCDDWFDSHAIASMVRRLREQGEVDAHFFAVNMMRDGRLTKVWNPQTTIRRRFAMPAPHPGMLMRRTAFMRFGGFSTAYRYSADYDLVLRVLAAGTFRVHDEAVSNFALGGASSTAAALSENGAVRKSNGVPLFHRAMGHLYDRR